MEYFAYSQKSFLYKYVVMLTDCDQFKHMSFANYLKLMSLATDALFSGVFSRNFLNGHRLKVNSSKMQFKRQSAPGDNLLVKVNSTEAERDDLVLLYTFLIEGSGELVGLGKQNFSLLAPDAAREKIPAEILGVVNPIFVHEDGLLYKY